MFKVGDKVWCMVCGWGEVVKTNIISTDNPCYPLCVEFEDEILQSYTLNGKFSVNGNRTLFFEEIPIPKSALKRKR